MIALQTAVSIARSAPAGKSGLAHLRLRGYGRALVERQNSMMNLPTKELEDLE